MASDELKPCPFCGGTAHRQASDIFCQNPRCGIYEKGMPDTKWNTRAPDATAPLTEALERAREALKMTHDILDRYSKISAARCPCLRGKLMCFVPCENQNNLIMLKSILDTLPSIFEINRVLGRE